MGTHLSAPLASLRHRYDIVVIGTGYGGAVVARQLAEVNPSLSICMLERGMEIRPGAYPTSLRSVVSSTQADSRLGHFGRHTSLFDVRVEKELTVLVGCGLGGTSLINAGVMLPPARKTWPEDVTSRWPAALRSETEWTRLAKLADDVKKTLGAAPVPDSLLPNVLRLEKARQLHAASSQVSPPTATEPAPIAVTFHTHVNAYGVQQARCTLCGNCMTGCNHSAKNTLLMNYLPAVAQLDVPIYCGVRVLALEPAPVGADGQDWTIHATLETRAGRVFGRPTHFIRAGSVFLAAGSLGSSEILLRSRERFGLELSPALGQHFSGNGDIIAFGYDLRHRVNGFGFASQQPIRMATGPTISEMIDDRQSTGVLIQEGAVPGALSNLMRFAGPFVARLGHVPRAGEGFSIRRLVRECDSLIRGAQHGTLARTQTYLAMGLDDGSGRMGLIKDRLRIRWEQVIEQQRLKAAGARLAALTAALGGMHVNALSQRLFGSRQFIAHPLGGCAMADTSDAGVVDDRGRVYRHRSRHPAAAGGETADGENASPVYPGLYVCDGAIVPTPVGSNPALTIAALAARIGDEASRAMATSGTGVPRPPAARVDTTFPGIRYGERLAGKLLVSTGQKTELELHLTLGAEDFEKLMREPQHELAVIGSMRTPDLGAGVEHWTISDGTLQVLTPDLRHVDTRMLVYKLAVTATNGTRLWLRGHKTISPSSVRRRTWKAATELSFVLLADAPSDGEMPYAGCAVAEHWVREPSTIFTQGSRSVWGAGIVAGGLADVVRMALSLEVLYEPLFSRRLRIKLRYAWFFVNSLIQARVWALRHTVALDPFSRNVSGAPALTVPVEGQESEGPRASIHDDQHKRFRLTRFAGPEGATPVILIPGFAMSTYWFRAALNGRQNITEFLLKNGYDVWLLDYRSSNRLPSSLEQFNLDDLAESDFPDAIARVRELSGQKPQVVAHCVGSLVMLMAMLKGHITRDLVQSAVLSQSFAFIHQPWPNRLKARLHLSQVLQFLGFRPLLSTQFDRRSSLGARIIDRLLYFYPSRERCTSGVCRRLLLVYGEAVRHEMMDADAHEKLYDMVDVGNLTTLSQLQRMSVRRRIVDASGHDSYVSAENFGRINIPLTLLQGEKNNLFQPKGAIETLDWLHQHGGFDTPEERRQRFTLERLPGFGHLDVFVGKDSEQAVYLPIQRSLTRMRAD